jgi:hypothetical protein
MEMNNAETQLLIYEAARSTMWRVDSSPKQRRRIQPENILFGLL